MGHLDNFNNSNDIEEANFLKWQRDLGDAASLADWENKFETVSASLASITSVDLPSGSASTTVPEPKVPSSCRLSGLNDWLIEKVSN